MSRVCAVIPTYNNAATLLTVASAVHAQLSQVFIVDDGSTDGTAKLLQGQPYTVLSHDVNRGKGAALATGFREALRQGYDHALTIDADGQHSASDIPAMLAAMEESPEAMILGRRDLHADNMPSGNTFANRFSNFWVAVQTGHRLPDTQTGFRIYPLHRVRGLKVMTSRYEAELELLVLSLWGGVKPVPVEVSVRYPQTRVSHYRPVADFLRISVLNVLLCLGAVVYGYPAMLLRKCMGT